MTSIFVAGVFYCAACLSRTGIAKFSSQKKKKYIYITKCTLSIRLMRNSAQYNIVHSLAHVISLLLLLRRKALSSLK